MNRRFTNPAAALLCLGLAAVMLPQAAAEVLYESAPVSETEAVSETAADSVYPAVSYKDSARLEALLRDIMENGNCGLFTDTNGTKAAGDFRVGGYLNGSIKYYARTDSGTYSWWGYQCYIYAQGVAARLFDEIVNHGTEDGTIYNHLIQVMGAAPSVTYSMMRDARVMPGAYMRTTINASGKYDGSNGHSLIILGYDENSIEVLEGNANGYGSIECNTLTYDEFNSRFLSGKGRYVSHMIQPNDTYYQQAYNLSWDMYAEPAETAATTAPVTTTAVTAPEFWEAPLLTMHRAGMHYQLSVPGEPELSWTSSDPDVLTVDESGCVTPLRSGEAAVTAESPSRSYAFIVSVDPVDWDAVGDADGDGIVTAKDAVQVLRCAAYSLSGFDVELDDRQMLCADIDDNGSITVVDAQQILRFFAKQTLMESSETPEEIWTALLN